jgi:Protein of unknown function (DUF3040)
MTPRDAPGPEESNALSFREQVILAHIADELTEADPGLSQRLNGRGSAKAQVPVSAKQVGLLAITHLVLLGAAAALPESWWAVRALLIALLVVPWIPFFAGARHPRM